MRKQSFFLLTGAAVLALGAAAAAAAPQGPLHGHHGCHAWGRTAHGRRHLARYAHEARGEGYRRESRMDMREGWSGWRGRSGEVGPGEGGPDENGWREADGRGRRHWGGEHGQYWGGGEHGRYGEGEWRSSHEEERSWSDVEGGAWAYAGLERPSAVDAYGFLTWPGKTHFGRHQPMEAPEAGPPPPEEGPPPPPPKDGYEIRRF
jgi:hypothetical protein